MGRPDKSPKPRSRLNLGIPIAWLIPIVLLGLTILFFIYLSFVRAA